MSLAEYSDAAVPTHDCGNLDAQCGYCGAYNYAGELVGDGPNAHFSICCGYGKYILPPFKRPPPELAEILAGTSFRARYAREQLKTYNNALSFVSIGADTLSAVESSGRSPSGRLPWSDLP